ncbi:MULTISPECIES: AraC family transcriptional regulator [unclassified Rhizobium]|uniref:helix-turn-helix domain-containing protein n=1 Tax=unclassified Rhizobium TaxID=2613769 RepID=UPI001608E024|nr:MULTISPECIES: AraC family transcriptional regulator [unclassified Rhizobium]MBB3543047.1 AraC-like DNA-binding protein [Rhizobium sp. BK399]MCS3742264.1 AraC-like DNA-binding protein [Rhizobium sp. BK661]
MEETGAYGERLRKTFKVARAPFVVAKTLKNARIAVTEIRCDKANTGLSEPIPVEDAFLMTVQLREVPAHDMFLDGKQVKTAVLPVGTASFYDLRTSPMANSISAFNHISFYVPRAALAAITDKEGIPPMDGFNHNPGIGVQDPVMYNLVRAMLPAFRFPGLANQLFVDHLTVAATAHAVRYHACAVRQQAARYKSLSSLELSMAQERLSEHLDGDLRLEDLSDECGMSPLEFASAFEETAGRSIHAWRGDLRIERAKRLIVKGYDTETTSGLLGYENAEDFVRDFHRRTGIDPRGLTRQ